MGAAAGGVALVASVTGPRRIALRALSRRNRQLARCRKVVELASAYVRAVDRGTDVTAAYGRLADGVRVPLGGAVVGHTSVAGGG